MKRLASIPIDFEDTGTHVIYTYTSLQGVKFKRSIAYHLLSPTWINIEQQKEIFISQMIIDIYTKTGEVPLYPKLKEQDMETIKAKDAKRLTDKARQAMKEEKEMIKHLSPVFKKIQKACDDGYYDTRVESLKPKEEEYLTSRCGYKVKYLFDQVNHYHYVISWE